MTSIQTNYLERIKELLPDLEYTATFIPQSKSRNKDIKQPTLNWSVTLKYQKQSITIDYSQGIQHIPSYKPNCVRTVNIAENEKKVAETGKYPKDMNDENFFAIRPLPIPYLPDVLSCLLDNAEAINYSSKEDWAECSGYNPDSIRDELIYKKCLEIGLKLRNMFGEIILAQLKKLFLETQWQLG